MAVQHNRTIAARMIFNLFSSWFQEEAMLFLQAAIEWGHRADWGLIDAGEDRNLQSPDTVGIDSARKGLH